MEAMEEYYYNRMVQIQKRQNAEFWHKSFQIAKKKDWTKEEYAKALKDLEAWVEEAKEEMRYYVRAYGYRRMVRVQTDLYMETLGHWEFNLKESWKKIDRYK